MAFLPLQTIPNPNQINIFSNLKPYYFTQIPDPYITIAATMPLKSADISNGVLWLWLWLWLCCSGVAAWQLCGCSIGCCCCFLVLTMQKLASTRVYRNAIFFSRLQLLDDKQWQCKTVLLTRYSFRPSLLICRHFGSDVI